jgi:hypothetical protein
MIRFERNRDPKEVMDVGLSQQIPEWIAESPFGFEYDHKKYMDVWMWALRSGNYDIVFQYIVDRHLEKWYSEVVDVAEFGNELLWESVAHNNIEAVKALLTVPDLFPEEAMSLDFGTCKLRDQYTTRGDLKSPMRTAYFGNIVELARTRGHNDLIDPLVNYYHEEYNRFRTREKS